MSAYASDEHKEEGPEVPTGDALNVGRHVGTQWANQELSANMHETFEHPDVVDAEALEARGLGGPNVSVTDPAELVEGSRRPLPGPSPDNRELSFAGSEEEGLGPTEVSEGIGKTLAAFKMFSGMTDVVGGKTTGAKVRGGVDAAMGAAEAGLLGETAETIGGVAGVGLGAYDVTKAGMDQTQDWGWYGKDKKGKNKSAVDYTEELMESWEDSAGVLGAGAGLLVGSALSGAASFGAGVYDVGKSVASPIDAEGAARAVLAERAEENRFQKGVEAVNHEDLAYARMGLINPNHQLEADEIALHELGDHDMPEDIAQRAMLTQRIDSVHANRKRQGAEQKAAEKSGSAADSGALVGDMVLGPGGAVAGRALGGTGAALIDALHHYGD